MIVDDEVDLTETLAYTLAQAGHRTVVARGGVEALQLALERPPSLIILDLTLPDISGREVMRRLRAEPRTRSIPVLVLSVSQDEADRLVCFHLGASDYVTKPFSPREVALRVAAILRRTSAAREHDGQPVSLGPLTVDPAAREVRVDGARVDLTPREMSILSSLLERRGHVLTRADLIASAWESDASVSLRAVDAAVMRLRARLGAASHLIVTVRGVGYRAVDAA